MKETTTGEPAKKEATSEGPVPAGEQTAVNQTPDGDDDNRKYPAAKTGMRKILKPNPFVAVYEDTDGDVARTVSAAPMAGGLLVLVEVREQGAPPMIAMQFVLKGKLSEGANPTFS